MPKHLLALKGRSFLTWTVYIIPYIIFRQLNCYKNKKPMTNDELLHKWINGTLSAEEEAIFRQRPEYEALTEVYRLTEDLVVPDFDEDVMLSNILKTEKEPQQTKTKIVTFSTYLKYGIAASILLFGTWFFFLQNNKQLIQIVATKEKVEGTLPDQSTFVLNLGSQLTYDEKTWSSNRSLSLEGEAFFKVKKGEQFKVNTENGSVQVLGTQFNVWSREGVLEVTCQSGKVAVLSLDEKVLKELNPTDVVRVLEDQRIETWTVPTSEKANWVNGISKLKNTSLARVSAELERQFDIKIITENVGKTGEISCNFQHQDLELALKTALSSFDVQYRLEGKQVIIFKE